MTIVAAVLEGAKGGSAGVAGISADVRAGTASLAVALGVAGFALASVAVAPPAQAGPIREFAKFVATQVEASTAQIKLESGRFVRDTQTNAIAAVNEAGRVLENLPLRIEVDGAAAGITYSIAEGGKVVSAVVDTAIDAGGVVAAEVVNQAGAFAEECVKSGVKPAIAGALSGAVTAASAAGVAAGPAGLVGGVAVGAASGAVTGFAGGCADGLVRELVR
ncbi:hypothetical protein FCG67_06930 [Rhodococcus oryzae]|uniref:DUF8020 domain-containing protein n=1 Tax=Rhodococcus oryzae TaxID=2571143 RepID=A0ABY2RM39_9NOCA|nr:hypothetical protein [Rhodococcus oryzae]TJZ79366.1 hypothetical protein FCG67_06930 [Rhodococcus oryzae]